MIQIRDLTFRYEGSDADALSGISLDVPDGGFLGIIGPSGAGKTTLTHAIDGIIPHHFRGSYYGKVLVNGLDPLEHSLCEITSGIGIVFQEVDSQIISAIVEDEVLYGMENLGVPHEEMEQRLAEALEMVGITELRYRDISSLSGGQKQKVVIACALALRPKVLLLDEPTGELDPRSSRQIFELLRKVNIEQGITIIIVEQKIRLLSEFAAELAVISGGRLALYGKVRDVLSHVDELEKLGVKCPRFVSFSSLMQKEGLSSGRICLTASEAAELVTEALE